MHGFRVATVVAFLGVGHTANAQISTVEGMQSFIENFVLSKLPDPTGDAVEVVLASPDLVKGAMIVWLNKKIADAETKEDWVHYGRYNAFYLCIAKSDCQALEKFQALQAPQAPQVAAAPPAHDDQPLAVAASYPHSMTVFHKQALIWPTKLNSTNFERGEYKGTDFQGNEAVATLQLSEDGSFSLTISVPKKGYVGEYYGKRNGNIVEG